MIAKMERNEEIQVAKESVKEVTSEVPSSKIADNSNDVSQFSRERNLLLLSALHKLYGEEWKDPPVWAKVAEEIQNAKIPVFGENFTTESCELQYKSLMGKGYQVGIGPIATVLKVPKILRLSDAQKRIWILANTANDIVETSKIMEDKMRTAYKQELAKIEKGTPDISDISVLELGKKLEISDDIESDEELDNEDDHDDPEFALEVSQCKVNEAIVGMKDVLFLIKYCNDAVENAVKKCKPAGQQPLQSSPKKLEKVVEFTKSTISTNQVSQELSNLVHTAIANASEDDKQKITPPKLPVTAPGMPLPEIPTVKQPEASPEKQAPKLPSRGNSKERTLPEPVKEESSATLETPAKDNGEQASSPVKSPAKSPARDTNGQAVESTPSIPLTEKSPSKSELSKEKLKNVESPSIASKPSTEKPAGGSEEAKSNIDPETSKTSKISPEKCTKDKDDPVADDPAPTLTLKRINSESSEVNEVSDSTRQESPTKGKQAGRKGSSIARPISTRTSSRLTSPEPSNEQPSNEEEKSPKKTPSRQTSSTESHTPILRSRRGATPTKAATVENEPVKSSSTAASKLDFTEENEEETFETPSSTPESPEVKSDIESIQETKPPKQLKVYSAKPPSPLSHVDPKLFDAFIDDEDDELAMIDSNVNKSKSDKTLSKTYSRRGRTVSSENTSDAGNNEESIQNKRVTRKIGIDEAEEGEGIGANTDESSSKRLTRSSLQLLDAANEEGVEAPQTESEKAASESSFSGKDKKPRTSKSMLRLKNLQDEITRVYGEGDETPEGKRLTRARAKTSTAAQPEKRSKPPSVGDSEGLSESEPTPTRATRSRSSTASSMPVLEPTAAQQPPTNTDDEEQKTFKKNASAFVEKIIANDTGMQIQKHLQDDPSKILKRNLDFTSIKNKIESGKARTISAIHVDLITLATNAIMAHPNSSQVKENVVSFNKFVKSAIEEFKNQRNPSSHKNDTSDVESLESHDEQRSETSSKQASGGGRRKRKRSASETSEEVLPQENKRRVTRTSTSSAFQQSSRKPKHPISPDIVYAANRVRH